MSTNIPFNKPCLTGKEAHYIYQAVYSGKLSGNGDFTKACHQFFHERYGFQKCLLTSSCTDALEMSAILAQIETGDEVIIPSYTFVSTSNAFVLRGAKIVFADSRSDHPGVDEQQLESLITARTKAIVPVHYAGVACDMDIIMDLAEKHDLLVIEDAAQSIDAFYHSENGTRKPLGGIGHLATFSYHETKNIISGEGGMLVVNDERLEGRSEIIWEKGTNRSAFFRGEVDKYGWVDIGSSYLPSEVTAAFLYAQLEALDEIQTKRKRIWDTYLQAFQELDKHQLFRLPFIPTHATNNAHMFYVVCQDLEHRQQTIKRLREAGYHAVFHYLSLHKSPFYTSQYNDIPELPMSDFYTDRLLRLPFFNDLDLQVVRDIVKCMIQA
ncbi:MAG: dTDP-4-amino-4,6-dideoxygalactose transaminase [Bacteroidota bacterium]